MVSIGCRGDLSLEEGVDSNHAESRYDEEPLGVLGRSSIKEVGGLGSGSTAGTEFTDRPGFSNVVETIPSKCAF